MFAVGEQACSVAEWVRRGIPWLRPDGRFLPMVVEPSDVQFAPSLEVDALCAVLQARGVAVPPALRERWLEPPNLAQIDRLLVLAATSPSPADVLAAAS